MKKAIAKRKPPAYPIFAVIDRHRTAQRARWVVHGIHATTAPTSARYEKSRARSQKKWDHEYKALEGLLACRPTTVDGFMALVAYVARRRMTIPKATRSGGAIESSRLNTTLWSCRLSRIAKDLVEGVPTH
jgi:hypothetical protein